MPQVKARVWADRTNAIVDLAVVRKGEACPCLLAFHDQQKMHSDVVYDLVRPAVAHPDHILAVGCSKGDPTVFVDALRRRASQS